MKVIENTAALEQFCATVANQEFITVDLEFLREKTYYAQLCLIQIGSKIDCAIIDPLAPDINLKSFFELMQKPSLTKVFHSGRQDIEIIFNLCGQIPSPVFDTQIAGMVTGFGDSIGYEHLVRHILQIELDKSDRLSDWSRRPLTEKQLQYALSDVTYLIQCYEYLRNQLKETGRESWIDEEMSSLCSPESYRVIPEEAWKRLRHRSHNSRFLTILRELASWRESRCQLHNVTRNLTIKDDALLQIATSLPSNREELSAIRALRPEISAGRLGEEILEVVSRFKKLPKNQYVIPPHEKALPHPDNALYEVLKMLLKIQSSAEGVASRLIATDDDLKLFSQDSNQDVPFLHGWRQQIFGKLACALCRGELCLSYNPFTRTTEFTTKK